MYDGTVPFYNLNVNTIGFFAVDQEELKKINILPNVGDHIKLTVNDTTYNLIAYEALEDYELPPGSIAICSQDPADVSEPDQYAFLVPPVEDYTDFNSLAQLALNGEHFDSDEYVEMRNVKIEIINN